MDAWSRKTLKIFQKFLRFLEKPPYGKIFKILFRKFSSPHRSTYCIQISCNLADGKSVKSCVAYLTKITFRLALQLSLLHGSRLKSARARIPKMYSECSRFNPNRFTFGRVIAERVNTAKTRRRVNRISGWSLPSSRIKIAIGMGWLRHSL